MLTITEQIKSFYLLLGPGIHHEAKLSADIITLVLTNELIYTRQSIVA